MLEISNSRRGAATIRERGDYFVQHFRRCGDYSRAATNRERRLIERIRYRLFALLCILGCLLALYGSTVHPRCIMWFLDNLFLLSVHASLKSKFK